MKKIILALSAMIVGASFEANAWGFPWHWFRRQTPEQAHEEMVSTANKLQREQNQKELDKYTKAEAEKLESTIKSGLDGIKTGLNNGANAPRFSVPISSDILPEEQRLYDRVHCVEITRKKLEDIANARANYLTVFGEPAPTEWPAKSIREATKEAEPLVKQLVGLNNEQQALLQTKAQALHSRLLRGESFSYRRYDPCQAENGYTKLRKINLEQAAALRNITERIFNLTNPYTLMQTIEMARLRQDNHEKVEKISKLGGMQPSTLKFPKGSNDLEILRHINWQYMTHINMLESAARKK